ncbi:MAG: hypothetical protein JSU80_03355 [Deltaproteobacteria bacterium]|jgi:hypothetical protein|nr:MAG: hypothetical protein JSU80_03355 [Deltaproteobacteria bacterium]
MDTDKILEKLMRWLSDPKGREMFKTIVYLIIPLFLYIGLRNIARRRPAEKSSSTIDPRIRPSSYESLKATESLRDTQAKEQKKIDKEMQELFGRKDTVMARARKEFDKSTADKPAVPSESVQSDEKNILQEELLKLFLRRQK